MGIPGLWEKLGDGEIVDIAAFAGKHFERTKRPLRIAVDEASWRYNFYLSKEKVAQIRKSCPPANPSEKNILWRLLQLLRLNCQLVFVFDGPGRPKKKGRISRETSSNETALLKKTLEHLSIPWHKAPGEAEAECAELQKIGVVDAVWTEDGDALVFGCTTLIRFFRKPTGKKDIEKIRIYKSKRITKQYKGLDREGLVLFAVLSGGDYDKAGLPGCGPDKALKGVAHGLGQALCSDNLNEFRDQLIDFYMCKGLKIPEGFPNPAHVKNYNHPLVSKPETLRMLQNRWDIPFDEPSLWGFLGEKYNLWAKEYTDLILPILLVRSLAQTYPGQESSNAVYEMRHVSRGGPWLSTISLILSEIPSITTTDMDSWMRKSSKNSWRPQHRVQCDRILDSIIYHGYPDTMKGVRAPIFEPSLTNKTNSLLTTKKRERLSKETLSETLAPKRPRRFPTPELRKPEFRRPVDISDDEFDKFDRLYFNSSDKQDEISTLNSVRKKEPEPLILRHSPLIPGGELDLFVQQDSKKPDQLQLDTDSDSSDIEILDNEPVRWEDGSFLEFLSNDKQDLEKSLLDIQRLGIPQSLTKAERPQNNGSSFSLSSAKGIPLKNSPSNGNQDSPKDFHFHQAIPKRQNDQPEDANESPATLSPATLRRARLKRFENPSKSFEEIPPLIDINANVETPPFEVVGNPDTAIEVIGQSKSSTNVSSPINTRIPVQSSPLEFIKIQDTCVEVIDLT